MTKEQAVVGAKVKSLRDFSRVPAGTVGVIDEDYGTGVMVKWQLPGRSIPRGWPALRDGFDKASELQYLDLIDP